MAISNSFGVVLAERSGKIFLVNVSGVDVKQAIQGGKDAITQLGQLAIASDTGDISSSIQGLPLSCGSIHIWNKGWRVFYRALGPIVAMVMSPASQNAFSSLELLAQVVRVVTADGKVPEVTAERVQRKHAEIYLALDRIVGSCGMLCASEALAEARATLEGLGSSASGAPTQGPVKHAGGVTIPPVNYTVPKRTLTSQAEQLGQLAFSSSGALSGLRPLPGFELVQQQQQAQQSKPPAQPIPILFQFAPPDAPKPGGTSNDPFEDIFGPITNAAIKPADADAGAAAAAAIKAAEGAAAAALVAAEADAAAAAKAAAVPVIPKPARPLLRLRETWRAEAEGGKIVRCGLEGRVTWAEDAGKDPVCPACLSLSSAEWASQQLKDHLAGAQRHSLATSIAPDGSGAIMADGASARMTPPPVLLRYHVPPGPDMQPPLLVNVGASYQATKQGSTVIIVGIRVALTKQPNLRFKAMDVSLACPPLYQLPVRVSPAGAKYDAATRQLCWSIPGQELSSEAPEVLAVVFKAAASEQACLAAVQQLVAEVELTGQPGGGLLGVILHQACEKPAESYKDETTSWRAHVKAVPSCTD